VALLIAEPAELAISTRQALMPPKPNELESTVLSVFARPTFGT